MCSMPRASRAEQSIVTSAPSHEHLERVGRPVNAAGAREARLDAPAQNCDPAQWSRMAVAC
jgi:hypothetical protein